MINILKNKNGMNVVGQGGKIILFMLPSLVSAILLNKYFPLITSLPGSFDFIRPIGFLLLIPGLLLWGAAVVQLIYGFSRGKLVTTGAYSIVRNPIYSSVTFFVFPAVSMITLTWVYFTVSVFVYFGVMIFIDKEERLLTEVFGKEYEDYRSNVDMIVPFGRSFRKR